MCTAAYANSAVVVTVNAGIQTWTAPFTGTYRIEAWGDSGLGGFGGGGNGGNGGGGYEGGNGGGINNTNAYGSGGKSFNSGTNPIGEDGIRVGQGELTITLL